MYIMSLVHMQDVGTCGDTMDIACLTKCINGSFDTELCKSCEPTRPIIVLRDDIPENARLNTYLEGIANNELGELCAMYLHCTCTLSF